MSKKWRGPWIGKKSDSFAPGATTVRLYPTGVPTIVHYDTYVSPPSPPAQMWGWETVWPLAGQDWLGNATLSGGGGPPYLRGVSLNGTLTQLAPSRNGAITEVKAGFTWHPVIEAGFGNANIRIAHVSIADSLTPWLTNAPWVQGYEMKKENVFNGNLLMVTSGSTKALETDVTDEYAQNTQFGGANMIGSDILLINSLYYAILFDMYSETAGCDGTFDLQELYVDVTYTQT
jgi:hypothetical protein